MRIRWLKLTPDVKLPLDAATQKIGFLGRTSSGKTYAAMKLAELMLENEIQIVALDPVGKWYGLRVPGNGPGFDIPVFGGLEGDIPLTPTGGALVADLICDRGISAVLDTSQMLSHEQVRFATDFATRLFQRKKSKPSPIHVFLEECQEFVPQNPSTRGGQEPMMLHAFERIVKLGRNFGIGVSLISQRPQEVNKKALNQTECLLAFQMTGPQERKAMVAWMGELSDKKTAIEITDSLPKLVDNHCILWSPSWLQVKVTTRVNEKQTADVSSTPKVGERTAAAQKLTPIDLATLRQDMAATLEKANAEDPKRLRARIAELEKQIKKGTPAPQAAPETKIQIEHVEVPVLSKKEAAVLEKLADAIVQASAKMQSIAVKATQSLEDVQKKIDLAAQNVTAAQKTIRSVSAPPPRTRRFPVPLAPSAPSAPLETAGHGTGDPDLPAGERAVLACVAQLGGADRKQITLLTGYKRSTRDTYIQRLATREYVIAVRDGTISITQKGVDAVGVFEKLPTGAALREHWKRKLPAGEAQIFSELCDAYPDELSRETLSEKTGFKRSTRDTYIQRLAVRKLIEPRGGGTVLAAPMLFEES